LTTRTKVIAIGAGVLVAAVGAFFVLSGKAEDLGVPGFSEPATCPLTGQEPRTEEVIDRPAAAVKIENSEVARPLSGLERADLVYEELVEGGETRFMAFFHCKDSSKAGPVRSARQVDPAILGTKTRILAYSGANQAVTETLDDAGVVSVTETEAGEAMQRVAREGISSEHTLYANSSGVRRVARDEYDDAPPDDLFEFGDINDGARAARSISINFGGASTITYQWSNGGYERSQDGVPFVAESGQQIAPANILMEEHRIRLSNVVDVTGTPSPIIVDETGSGRAVLFRDGRAIVGRWSRESLEDPVVFETRNGDAMVFSPGSIWIELVPSPRGEVKGSFEYER
jgi:Protein of unknown function (DUF3048) N-terminal domain/Protein of unknown function (DUF3048) C-terminal domain